MNYFKFLRGLNFFVYDYSVYNEPQNRLIINNRPPIENVEFCFQFDDEEPVRFAVGPNECHIRINPTQEGYMIFTDNGRRFKLFARERQ